MGDRMPLENHLFARHNPMYPEDRIYVTKPSFNFQGNMTYSEIKTELSQTPRLLRCIDDAVIVESVDDKTRLLGLNHFSSMQQQASSQQRDHKSNVYKGMAATAFGVGLGIACPVLIPMSTGLIAGTAAGLGISILGVRQVIHSQHASNKLNEEIHSAEKMKEQWRDPIDDIVEKRKLAGTNGFHYVYTNNLKNKIIHEEEVKKLWMGGFSNLISHRQDIEQVFRENLLGKAQVVYAWGEAALPDIVTGGRHFSSSLLNALIVKFEICRHAFQDFEGAIAEQYELLNRNREQITKEISNLRSHWLYPADCLYSNGIREARRLYDSALRPFLAEKNEAIRQVRQSCAYTLRNTRDPREVAYKQQLDALYAEEVRFIEMQYSNHPAVMEIERAYARDRQMCQFLYNQSRLVVDAHFDNRLRLAEQTFRHLEEQITSQRRGGHQQFRLFMDEILACDSEESLHRLSLIIPNIERNWRLPNFSQEPSWSEIYGQIPHFQSHFTNIISEQSWNLFWSENGLGCFASHPTTSWNQLFGDNSRFPFTRRLFNLRSSYQHPQERIFSRPVNVPIPPSMERRTHYRSEVQVPRKAMHEVTQTVDASTRRRGAFEQEGKTWTVYAYAETRKR